MPCKSFKCSECGKKVTFTKGTRLEAIRKHYKDKHPEKWKKSKRKRRKK